MRTFYWQLIAVLAIVFPSVVDAAPVAPGDIIFAEFFDGWHKLDPATGQISEITEWNGTFSPISASSVTTIAFDVDGAILYGHASSIIRLDPWTGDKTFVRSVSGQSSPGGFVVESNGDLLIADGVAGLSRFSRATQTLINLIPGTATFSPRGITRTADGRIFVTDPTADILEVDLQSATTAPVTTTNFTFTELIVNRPDGQLLTQSRGLDFGLFLVDPDTGNSQLFSDALRPAGKDNFAFDASGALWQGGSNPNGIYRYPPEGGTPTLFPGGTFFSPKAIVVVPLDWTPPPVPEPNGIALITAATIGLAAYRRSPRKSRR